jgi:pimeloyl-ACP methyl ester carboxylesterase
MEPFRIQVSEAARTDLRRRLAEARITSAPSGEAWESGVDYGYLTDLIEYWRDDFDWRRQEDRLNSLPHYQVDVGDQNVHFLHVRADPHRYSSAIPLILSHGWPYSFIEFLPIIPWLTDPEAHGGTAGDAFDVVVPSLPGFGYSAPMVNQPFTGESVAELWHALMTEQLGYRHYATYGEDVGTTVSDWLGALYPDAIIGLFTTHAAFPPAERSQDLTAAEDAFREWLNDKWRTGRGYSEIQSTRPDTLAIGLNDSPAGLLAWLVEKFREWSGPDFEEAWSRDDVLTTTCLYWFTETIGTSFLPYYDDKHERPVPLVTVPVGVAVQWGERDFPREYAARTYTDMRMWSDLPRGGHFTAKQTPDLVACAMREFFAPLRD